MHHGQDEIVHLFLGTTQRLTPSQSNLPITLTTTTTTTLQSKPPQDLLKHYQDLLLQARKVGLIEEQIFYLDKMGDACLQNKNFVQAALILNAALAFLKAHKQNPFFEEYLLTKLARIEGFFLESQHIKTPAEKRGCLKHYRLWLEQSRQQSKTLNEYTQEVKRILKVLIMEAQELLGSPPVAWACLGLGSMSRGEMCPYSDLEFAFVIDKETPEALSYFRILSRFLQIRIINFGETKAPVFGPREPSPTPNGFCMDTGGNVPLGGIFELIATPAKLAQTQTSQWIDTSIILANVMNSTCLIAGEPKLAEKYHKQKEEVHKQKENTIENRKKLALRLLAGHLREFSPNLTQEKEEIKAFGIKKELYRPFQEILSSLCILYQVPVCNTFERIDALLKLKVFSPKGAENLKKALSQALALRLEAHLFYKDEIEYLHQIEEGKPQDKDKLYLTPEKVTTVQEIYKVLIPFCKATQKFYTSQDTKEFCTQTFYDDDPLVQAEALKRSLQYTAAKEAYQHAVSLNPNNVDALLYLGKMEIQLGDAEESLKRAQQALQLTKQRYGEQNHHVAASLNNIGGALDALGKPAEGLDYYKQALKILKTLYGEQHPDVAGSLNNIGMALDTLGKTAEGLVYYKQALEIQKKLYGEQHPDVALSLNNIGLAFNTLGKPTEGLIYLKQALEIDKTLYGEQHPNVATSLNSIGLALNTLGKPTEGLVYFKQALEVFKNLYGQQHPHVASGLFNIGDTLLKMGNFPEALNALQKALSIYLHSYGPDHPLVKNVQNWIVNTQKKIKQ
jgi:tetratricopeptide (TPR) repeat protein